MRLTISGCWKNKPIHCTLATTHVRHSCCTVAPAASGGQVGGMLAAQYSTPSQPVSQRACKSGAVTTPLHGLTASAARGRGASAAGGARLPPARRQSSPSQSPPAVERNKWTNNSQPNGQRPACQGWLFYRWWHWVQALLFLPRTHVQPQLSTASDHNRNPTAIVAKARQTSNGTFVTMRTPQAHTPSPQSGCRCRRARCRPRRPTGRAAAPAASWPQSRGPAGLGGWVGKVGVAAVADSCCD